MTASDTRLQEFLADTLALWRVDGVIEPGTAPVVATVRTTDGTTISIERPADPELPLRWLVRRCGATRPRACASVVGLLNALRSALGVDRDSPLRVAPARSEP